MEECGGSGEFPGFQTVSGDKKEEYQSVFRRSKSRLQSRAPCPLQLNIIKAASESESDPPSSSSFVSCYNDQSKDPIPLLSPLVLPSFIQEGNNATAKSH